MNFKKIILPVLAIAFAILTGCSQQNENKTEAAAPAKKAENKIIVFHAGSLSVPLLKLKEAYTKINPAVNIILEAAGSRTCARKIVDLKKPCDLMVSADYKVIDNLLIPEYADWNIKFATNQLSVVYTPKSKFAGKINTDNWYKILMQKDVICGASNPNDDPCGYRTILMLKLATIFYKEPTLYDMITLKDKMVIRPKETDLIALLEANAIDYMFIYKSVAIQHELKYVVLPNQINLSDPEYADFYEKAEVKISGKTPGTTITQVGSPIVYGVTIPKNAPDKNAAIKFLKFMLSDKGMAIMNECGQDPIVPAKTDTFAKIPEELQKFAKPL